MMHESDITSFVAESKSLKEVLKSALLLKNLNINVLILGDSGVGKTTLAHMIVPDAVVVTKNNMSELSSILENNSTVIIEEIDNFDFTKIDSFISSSSTRIIATTTKSISNELSDKIFGIKIYIPPLIDRTEDIIPLAQMFLEEAKSSLHTTVDVKIDHELVMTKLNQNCHSLKKYIYSLLIFNDISDTEIMGFLEYYVEDKIGGINDYRELLYIYEVPLLRAELNKFKSQLQVAKHMGLNRNTLRKKIQELEEYL
jgi:DNA-binding NtrC family response regulator